jgi:hypothetical protein
VLKEIIADEHVPFLGKFRYSGTGLLKRLLWEKTWDQQREEAPAPVATTRCCLARRAGIIT